MALIRSNHSTGRENSARGCPSRSKIDPRLLAVCQDPLLKDGEPTKELACMREALRPLRELYGSTPAQSSAPRPESCPAAHGRPRAFPGVVNHRVSRIKRAFKWAVAEELIPPSVFHGFKPSAGFVSARRRPAKPSRSDPSPTSTSPLSCPLSPPRGGHDQAPAAERHAGRRNCRHAALRHRHQRAKSGSTSRSTIRTAGGGTANRFRLGRKPSGSFSPS